MSLRFQRSLSFVLLSSALALTSCANKSDMDPMVRAMEVKETQDAKEPVRGPDGTIVTPGIPGGAIESTITLDKTSLLNRVYLYGAALQNSSIREEELETALMGISLTQLPARFRILDNKLRLETDASINFESDVPMPPRLVLELPITSQDDSTITVKADRASPILGSFLFGKDSKPVKYSYIRSMERVAADELFLIETTIELEDGNRAGFMESIRPRDLVIPADAKLILADAEQPLAQRYRFLDAGEFFHESKPGVRTKTKAATRFLRKNGEAIKWYVFGNVPEQYMKDLKNGVEAWNRYQPNLISFEGKLPEGVKVGDPRYNTIIWDTVQEAGAAYESQNADPVTGIQTQSLIYIPLAWINIGKDYWNKMTPGSQQPGDVEERRAARTKAVERLLKSRKIAGRALPVHCLEAAKELNVRLDSNVKPEDFARELLKGVVMHEVGHALGLAHNFRGSLSYDADDASKPFTTSIMDYNHYNEEDGAFAGLEEATGPQLEYDRQIISVLYNEGKDVKETDAEVPVCNDEEADSNEGGVDPLCNRYDIGADPTVQALRALDLFTKEGAKRGKMVSITAEKVAEALIPLPPASAVKTKDELSAALAKGVAGMSGTVGIYIGASANSFGYLASQAMRSLKVFRDDVLPEELKEEEMRERALQAFEAGTSMVEFPAVTKAAVESAKAKLLEYLASTAYVASLDREPQEKIMAALTAAVNKGVIGMEKALLSRLRLRFIQALPSTPTAPLAFHKRNERQVDLEQVVMTTLANLTTAKAGSLDRPAAERLEAIKALKTYNRSEAYESLAAKVLVALEAEIQSAETPQKRETARALKAELQKKPEEKKPDAKK
jgi:hypothetical protein